MNKKHFYECRCEFDGGMCYSKQKWNNDKCQDECKKLQNIAYAKKIMPALVVYVLTSVTNIVTLVNI